jgi:hypothetical protein
LGETMSGFTDIAPDSAAALAAAETAARTGAFAEAARALEAGSRAIARSRMPAARRPIVAVPSLLIAAALAVSSLLVAHRASVSALDGNRIDSIKRAEGVLDASKSVSDQPTFRTLIAGVQATISSLAQDATSSKAVQEQLDRLAQEQAALLAQKPNAPPDLLARARALAAQVSADAQTAPPTATPSPSVSPPPSSPSASATPVPTP